MQPPGIPVDIEDVVAGTMERVLKVFCIAFEGWWARHPVPRQTQLLDLAMNENEHFTVSSRSSIERGVRDVVPICQLLSAVGSEFNLNEYDVKRVRQYRNKLSHKDKTERGQLHYMRLETVEDFLDATSRLVQRFGRTQDHAQLKQLGDWVLDRLYLGDAAAPAGGDGAVATPEPIAPEPVGSEPREPRPEPPRPPRVEDPPFQLPPRRTKSSKVRAEIELDQLSPDQRVAVDGAIAWFRAPGRSSTMFAITGPAGSGKTTVVSAIIEKLGLQPDHLMMVAPTGKAVEALKQRLPRGWRQRASTLASFLWKYEKSGYRGQDIEFVMKGSKPIDPKLRLVVVDEASMVTHRDRRQLETYARVLFIGDADQLPPVIEEGVSEAEYGAAGVLDKPDARLETVHRQDTESSVLSVANAVRQGRQPEEGVSPDGHVFCLSEAAGHFGVDQLGELVDRSDVVLVQRNSLRVAINEYVRWKRGYMQHPTDFVPKAGEILVASENYFHPKAKIRLANGERLVVERYIGTTQVRSDEPGLLEYVVQAHPEGRKSESQEWVVSSQMLAGEQIRGGVLFTENISGPLSNVLRADWGYALTVHKAQGSEWPSVLVVDDMNPDHKIPREKWYYVAYSRASAQLGILRVRPDTLLFTVQWSSR
ncbi:MAG: hypothetical protein RL721_2 [Candidatus Eisenbacteria bacterium]